MSLYSSSRALLAEKRHSVSSAEHTDLKKMKKIRITDFAKKSHVTAKGLASVLREVRDTGLPEATSASTIRRERQARVRHVTDYGPIVTECPAVLEDGSPVNVPIQAPIAMLSWALENNAEFASLMRATLEQVGRQPDNPLRIVIYNDGVTPNDALKTISKKTEIFYWSILDLGSPAIFHEDMWFTVATVRVDEVGKLKDGLLQPLAIIIRSFYGGIQGDVRHGVPLTLHGNNGPILVFAKLSMLIGDEAALKAMTAAKGASGTKLCCCCLNLVDHDSSWLPDPTGYHVPSTCLDNAKLKLHTDDTVRAILEKLQRLKDTRRTKEEFGMMQQINGFNYAEYNPFARPEFGLGLISMLVWDWMHIYLTSGIFEGEINCLLKRVKGCAKCHEYVQLWTWPKAYPASSEVFTKGRLDGTASQLMSLSPVLHRWITSMRKSGSYGAWEPELQSASAMCDIIDVLHLSQKGLATSDLINEQVNFHLHLHQMAYGFRLWKWKHHAATHLGHMHSKHGCLVPCFLHEKKHKLVTRFGRPRTTLTGFSMGLLEECTLHHMSNLEDFAYKRAGLAEPRQALKKMTAVIKDVLGLVQAEVTTSKAIMQHNRQIVMGDVVLARLDDDSLMVASVWFHCAANGQTFSCICPFSTIERGPCHMKAQTSNSEPILVASDVLEEAVIHSKINGLDETVCAILLPPHLR